MKQPIYDLAGYTIDVRSGLASLLPFWSAAQFLSRTYSRLLFGAASLQDLPDKPRFTFNSTNFATGSLFRWSKEYGADYQAGSIFNPCKRWVLPSSEQLSEGAKTRCGLPQLQRSRSIWLGQVRLLGQRCRPELM